MFLLAWSHAFSMCRGHQDPLAAEERRWVMGWGTVSPPIAGIVAGGTLGPWVPRWVSDPSLLLSFLHRGSLAAPGTLLW